MTATEIAGLAGAGLAGAAYVPQISHLVRAHCAAGISPLAFAAWLLASVLTTAHAIAIGAAVFVVLGGTQIVATTLIMLCAARYKDTPCPSHPPTNPRPKRVPLAGERMSRSSAGGQGHRLPLQGLTPTLPERAVAAGAPNFNQHA
jgi:PQ loop repeat protein